MQIQRWVSGETTVNYAVGPVYYNTALSLDNASPTRNAELTIYLRVLMLPLSLHFAKTVQLTDAAGNKYSGKVYDVPDPNMPGRTRQVEVRNWNTNGTHSEFEQFKQMVKMHAEIFWNNTNLCLIPPPSYSGLDWPTTRPTHRLNLDCKFEIV